MSEKISVIIPNFNTSSYLYSLLNDIKNNNHIPNEIIIIDDCSTDINLGPMIDKFYNFFNIKFIQNKINIGCNGCWNLGTIMASNPLLCFLNSDIIINKYFFRNINKVFEQNKDIGLLYNKTIDMLNNINLDSNANIELIDDKIIEGWAFTIRKEIILKYGLIPTPLKNWYGDFYFYECVKKSNYKIKKIKNNFLFHYGSASFKKISNFINKEESSREFYDKFIEYFKKI